jgi:DNA polymerase I-like protein with 3'-5' exonuclease and polymerase domains
MITIDFETHAIDGALPPKPVGVSVKMNDQPSVYLHWGHPDGSNIAEEGAKRIVADCFRSDEILCHNGKFDLSVAKYHWGLDFPQHIHDTEFLLFLEDPHNDNLSLKPNSERLLGLPPVEQADLHDWIRANVSKKGNPGAYIAKAPSYLVAPYACSDTDRTYEVFRVLHDKYKGVAYDREIELLPILAQSTLDGVRVDEAKLHEDIAFYRAVLEFEVDESIFSYLGSSGFNIDSDEELANAIDASHVEVEWVRTPAGKRSTSKENLPKALKDQYLLSLLRYRGILGTCLSTFMEPWAATAVNGRVHFDWNQVRSRDAEAKKSKGARTGRLSSSPSMLNVPRKHGKLKDLWENLKLPPLPNVRNYMLPDEGQQWLKRDYCSQEIRVLAHYEDAELMREFITNPRLDMHDYMQSQIVDTLGMAITRDEVKIVAFSIIYGAGLSKLAHGLKCSLDDAATIKRAYLSAVPGIKAVQADIKRKWGHGLPITTFGGRQYYKEPSREVNGVLMDFMYKGLNYLIQGSSADITKQAIINYNKIRKNGRFLVAVHDEINITGGRSEMALLNEAMRDIPLDVPLLSDGSVGPSYGALTPIEDEEC